MYDVSVFLNTTCILNKKQTTVIKGRNIRKTGRGVSKSQTVRLDKNRRSTTRQTRYFQLIKKIDMKTTSRIL